MAEDGESYDESNRYEHRGAGAFCLKVGNVYHCGSYRDETRDESQASILDSIHSDPDVDPDDSSTRAQEIASRLEDRDYAVTIGG